MKAGAIALCGAGVAHLNEVALLIGASMRSPAFAAETSACKGSIMAYNRGDRSVGRVSGGIEGSLKECRNELTPYHVERPFMKATISPVDRELFGRGFGFIGRGGNPSPK